MTLAGHTHGGQIKFPMMQPLWVPSEFGARFAYGHIVENDRHMIVSGGLGTSIVPMRLGVPPEIVRSDWAAPDPEKHVLDATGDGTGFRTGSCAIE